MAAGTRICVFRISLRDRRPVCRSSIINTRPPRPPWPVSTVIISKERCIITISMETRTTTPPWCTIPSTSCTSRWRNLNVVSRSQYYFCIRRLAQGLYTWEKDVGTRGDCWYSCGTNGFQLLQFFLLNF